MTLVGEVTRVFWRLSPASREGIITAALHRVAQAKKLPRPNAADVAILCLSLDRVRDVTEAKVVAAQAVMVLVRALIESDSIYLPKTIDEMIDDALDAVCDVEIEEVFE